ncbi:TniQ family protein [Vibrio sp.]|nr:TniQ family protein [Vibrio sp.]
MFLQRPKPHQDESLESFFIRVANNNGYDDISKFLSAVKRYLVDKDPRKFDTFPSDVCLINPYSSKNHSTSRTHALHHLSQLTFNEPQNILGLAINRSQIKYSSSSSVIRGAELFPRSLLRTQHVPCCPQCLQENGYACYLWHFSGIDYCPLHREKLVYTCQCGREYDYRKDGLTGVCPKCGEMLGSTESSKSGPGISVSQWLSGQSSEGLPDLPASYRWGLVHWWTQIHNELFDNDTFLKFWQNWPHSFHDKIKSTIEFNIEYTTVNNERLRLKDLLGSLLLHSFKLPSHNLRYNLILKEIFSYLDIHLWENHGLLANLKMNAFEVAILLNTTTDEIASMVEQRLLLPKHTIKNSVPLNNSHYLFHLGDVYCLWLSEFQTDEFNRSFYVSRW